MNDIKSRSLGVDGVQCQRLDYNNDRRKQNSGSNNEKGKPRHLHRLHAFVDSIYRLSIEFQIVLAVTLPLSAIFNKSLSGAVFRDKW